MNDIQYHPRAVDRYSLQNKYVQLALVEAMKTMKDNLGDDARKHVYVTNILPKTFYHNQYRAVYDEVTKYDRDVAGLQEIKELVSRIGWKQFLLALEYFIVRRSKLLQASGIRVTPEQVSKTVKKVKDIPKWPHV